MKQFLTLLFLLVGLGASPAAAQQGYVTISGYIEDATSHEALIGASIYAPELGQGTMSNSQGFYSLHLPRGTHELSARYLGYAPYSLRIQLERDTTLRLQLRPTGQLEDVVITAERQRLNLDKLGVLQAPVHILKKVPSLLGEADLMKALQLMPGVQSGSDGSAGIHVRGGGSDENLILLDGAPLYNVDHLMGFFSVFTPEAVKTVDLYKGSFPARYGGRLSSVIDVRTKDGDLQHYHGALQLGLISSRLQVEGPIVKGRSSFNLSLRRSYADLLARAFMPRDERGGYYFYDLYAKLQHRFSERDRLFLSFYNGRDRFWSDFREHYGSSSPDLVRTEHNKGGFHWGNTLGALRWNHVFSPRLYSDLSVAYTGYRFHIDMQSEEERQRERYQSRSAYRSGIEDLSAAWHLNYFHSNRQQLRFGLDYIHHRFRPEAMSAYSRSERGGQVEVEDLPELLGKARVLPAEDLSAYLESRSQLGQLQVDAGLRTSLYVTEGKQYLSLQPRLALGWRLHPDWLLQAGYTRMAQHVHLLTSSTLTLPSDLWVPVTKRIRPMYADQLSLGLSFSGLPGWSLSLEGYYKEMHHVLEYKDGASFIGSSAGWEDKVAQGQGRAYGLELMLMRQLGRTTGWLSYSWAHSQRRYEDGQINGGAWYPYKYDRRHHLNLVVTQHFSKRFELSAAWELFSGGVITLPLERMSLARPEGSDITGEAPFVERRNNYRLPVTHRLSLSANLRRVTRRGHESIWNFSLYNAYNQQNPSFVIPSRDYSVAGNGSGDVYRLKLYQYSILPILPSVSYTYKF